MEKKPLKLSDVKKELPFSVSKKGQFDWFENLILRAGDMAIDFDVFLPSKGFNLQRPFVWTLHQKQEFIMSILKENPIPKVSIVKYWDTKSLRSTKIEVIDGKQRMSAFIEFCKDGFPLASGHLFSDFAPDAKMVIYRFYSGKDECTLYGNTISDEAKITWFTQINFAGTPQDIEHLNKLQK